MHKVNDTDGPLKTLRGFQRVDIAAGKTNQVTIKLPPSTFEFFDRTMGRIAVAHGEYEVLYGTSSANKDLKSIKVIIL